MAPILGDEWHAVKRARKVVLRYWQVVSGRRMVCRPAPSRRAPRPNCASAAATASVRPPLCARTSARRSCLIHVPTCGDYARGGFGRAGDAASHNRRVLWQSLVGMKLVVILAMALFFLAESYLPCALKQMSETPTVPTFLKMSWRAQASLVLLLPSVVAEAWGRGGKRVGVRGVRVERCEHREVPGASTVHLQPFSFFDALCRSSWSHPTEE